MAVALEVGVAVTVGGNSPKGIGVPPWVVSSDKARGPQQERDFSGKCVARASTPSPTSDKKENENEK